MTLGHQRKALKTHRKHLRSGPEFSESSLVDIFFSLILIYVPMKPGLSLMDCMGGHRRGCESLQAVTAVSRLFS
jgi:hypothetical protein